MKPILFTIALLSLPIFLYGQKKSKKKELDKSTLIELSTQGKVYPKSYFSKLVGDSLELFSEVKLSNLEVRLEKNVVPLDRFEHIKIINNRKRTRNSLLFSLGVGATAFIITQQLAKQDFTLIGSNVLDAGTSGIAEGIIVGGSAFGFAYLGHQVFTDRRMNIAKQKRKIIRELNKI